MTKQGKKHFTLGRLSTFTETFYDRSKSFLLLLRKINLRFLASGICRIIDDTLRAHICTTVATDRNISSRVKISKYKISRMHSRSTFARRALSYSFNLSSTINSPRERFTISVHLTQENLPFTFIFSLFLLIVRKIS